MVHNYLNMCYTIKDNKSSILLSHSIHRQGKFLHDHYYTRLGKIQRVSIHQLTGCQCRPENMGSLAPGILVTDTKGFLHLKKWALKQVFQYCNVNCHKHLIKRDQSEGSEHVLWDLQVFGWFRSTPELWRSLRHLGPRRQSGFVQ